MWSSATSCSSLEAVSKQAAFPPFTNVSGSLGEHVGLELHMAQRLRLKSQQGRDVGMLQAEVSP